MTGHSALHVNPAFIVAATLERDTTLVGTGLCAQWRVVSSWQRDRFLDAHRRGVKSHPVARVEPRQWHSLWPRRGLRGRALFRRETAGVFRPGRACKVVATACQHRDA
jgi:hypothetical protein